MDKKKIPLVEHPLFMVGLTMLGGFMNAYTYVTRGGLLCTMHTGNMARFGLTLADGNWTKSLSYFIPIISCVIGSACSEFVKERSSKEGDWRKNALLIEALALILVAFVPSTAASLIVTSSLAAVAGFQFSLFRAVPWGAHSTVVCTGNLRSLGQYLYSMLHERTPAAVRRFFGYFCVVFSFSFGTVIGVHLSRAFGVFSSFAGAAMACLLFLLMALDEKK